MAGQSKQTKRSVDIGIRIKSARNKKQMTTHDFGKIMGVSASAVSNWEAGRAAFPAETLVRIAKALSVSPGWLLDGRDSAEILPLINVMGLAKCDVSGWFNTNKIAVKVPLPPGLTKVGNVFAGIAIGRSMEPDGIREGHVFFCDPDESIENGDAVFIQTKDGKATVKRFLSMDKTTITLRGWMDPDKAGRQKWYDIELARDFVDVLAVVTVVKRKP